MMILQSWCCRMQETSGGGAAVVLWKSVEMSVTGGQGAQLSRYSESLWAGWSRDRIPVGARFSAPDQIGSETRPTSYTMGTGSFLGVQRPGRGVDHPPHLASRLKKEQLYHYSPYVPLWPGLGWPLPLPYNWIADIFPTELSYKEFS